MAAVFAGLYFLERRERIETQQRYEKFLVEAPAQMKDFADAQTAALDNLERAFIASNIKVPRRKREDTNNGEHSD